MELLGIVAIDRNSWTCRNDQRQRGMRAPFDTGFACSSVHCIRSFRRWQDKSLRLDEFGYIGPATRPYAVLSFRTSRATQCLESGFVSTLMNPVNLDGVNRSTVPQQRRASRWCAAAFLQRQHRHDSLAVFDHLPSSIQLGSMDRVFQDHETRPLTELRSRRV